LVRVMIADDNINLCEAVEAYLSAQPDMECVGQVGDGRHVLPMVQRLKPDVLLLDVVMPYVDGIAVLEKMKSTLTVGRPRVIMVSAFGQERYVGHANRLGADYYLMKPFSLAVLVERIRQVMTIRSSLDCSTLSRSDLNQVKEQLVRYFEQMGVPPHYKGYRYLLEAVCLAYSDPSWLNGITKRLYPAVARRFGTSGSQVERAMRHAIEVTWEKGNLEQLNYLFPYEVDAERGKPTNSSFIAKMADIIALDLDSA
jgi:two-component system response regulator (stage 0 sporulation protein A)